MGAIAPNRAETTSNTTNNYTTSTSLRDIGFTGEQGVAVLNTLTEGVVRGLASVVNASENNTNQTRGLLTDIVASSERSIDRSYEFSRNTVDQSAILFDRTASRTQDTLNGIINATRDFSQRAISASTGQDTPLQTLNAASNETSPIEPSGLSNPIVLAAIIGAVALIFGGK